MSDTTTHACNAQTGQCECASTHDGSACERLKCPITTKAECNGRGACSTDIWPGDGRPAGECVCDAAVGFTGPSCDRAPGCSDTNPTCTGNGICDSSSGTCACSQKTYQTNPLCPDYECPVPGGKISKRRRSNVAVIIIVSL